MKIFKWRIFSNERLERIKKLLEGGEEDRKIASELLLSSEKKRNTDYPKYRIEVNADKAILYYKLFSHEDWKEYKYISYDGSEGREAAIKELKSGMVNRRTRHLEEIEKLKFKKYTINL